MDVFPCSLNSVSAMLLKNFVWLTQRSALGREPSLSHGLTFLLQTLQLGRGNLNIFLGFFLCVCYSHVSTFTVLSEIVKNSFAALPAVCRKKVWPKQGL
jgi:heme A synthase